MKKFFKFFPLIFLVAFVIIVFRQFFFSGQLPIPADTIVGLYHPWRDALAGQYPNGLPFKNFLITDPVRQTYPWRQLAMSVLKSGQVPWWNPYSFSGAPLLANLQSAVFYPLNLLYIFDNFPLVWSWQIVFQVILGGLFMWLYLRHFRLHLFAQALGVLTWVGSGFWLSWLEWNTLVQAVLWLPLLLLCVEKLNFKYGLIFVFALTASFLAGHLQTFAYVFSVVSLYIMVRRPRLIARFLLLYLLFFAITAPVWWPAFGFIQQSARSADQSAVGRVDWFLPWQNLAQFVAPDFFGNPATLNYFGVWNYQEFIGYTGIAGLVFSLLAVFFRRDKKTLFWGTLAVLCLALALPTPLAKIMPQPAQPTRLLSIIDFCLAMLAALGLDLYLHRSRRIFWLVPITVLMIVLVLFVVAAKLSLAVSLHNLYLPIALAAMTLVLFINRKLAILILLLALFDLSRFFIKFESFSNPTWLFPQTKVVSFLQDQTRKDTFRIAATDDRIFPPNFSVDYKLQMVSGYDPLYLLRYGEFVAAMERGKPDISAPLGFNRIITPKNYRSKLFNLLNVKYLLSLDPVADPQYQLVFQERETKVYENKAVLPRAFFVAQVVSSSGEQDTINRMFAADFDPANTAVVQNQSFFSHPGQAQIKIYNENSVVVETSNTDAGFLVLTDNFYPGWQATIDGQKTTIYLTDFAFRGVVVPAGQHVVRFYLYNSVL
ncbi:MAG: YfhO family protein [Patescibacteria group bacterium]|nr:YfhO family protein [Patescibacteria group bacterium]MCL5431554.1 YfhO family protein [Patescibacteria group bacterium]